MGVEQTQVCKTCKEEVPMGRFATYMTKTVVKHRNSCNRCSRSYVPKQTGFNKLDADVQTSISNDLESVKRKKSIQYTLHQFVVLGKTGTTSAS